MLAAGQRKCRIFFVLRYSTCARIKDFSPRFLRRYLDLEKDIQSAIAQYVGDVRDSEFPNERESY